MLPKMRWALPLIAALPLAGCVTAGSRPSPAPAAPATQARIPLQVYTKEAQARLADEMDASVASDAWPGFVIQYGQLRRAVCAAEGWRQPACRAMRTAGGSP